MTNPTTPDLAVIPEQPVHAAPQLDGYHDEVLRRAASQIRHFAKSKGWGDWAAAYIDPDVDFASAEKPSFKTLVTELHRATTGLRRDDRFAVLREADATVYQMFVTEPDAARASALYDVLLRLRAIAWHGVTDTTPLANTEDTLAAEVDRLRARVAELEAAAEQADDDEMVRCAALHCPNGEQFALAIGRGWAPGHMGTWLCPQHRAAKTVKHA